MFLVTGGYNLILSDIQGSLPTFTYHAYLFIYSFNGAIVNYPLSALRRGGCIFLWLWGFIATASAAVPAEGPWGVCHTHSVTKPRTVFTVPEESPTRVDADNADMRHGSLSVFRGNALLRRAAESLAADTVIYDEARDTAEAQGNVHYKSDTLDVTGDAGFMALETETGYFDNARFRFEEQHARGTARVVIKENADVVRLKDATYTTCDPGREMWLLKAPRVNLDQATGMGEAYNATVRFLGIPFLYIPYISFPITDARKTGFLIPRITTSAKSGTEIRIPYYLNLAPHRDATITPRIMTERGVLVDAEFRYINRVDTGLNLASSGQLDVGYLPNDDVYGKDRLSAAYRNTARLAPYWNSDLTLNYVSDKDYLGDFGNGLSVASVTHMERRLDVIYQRDNTYFLTRVQGLQPVDNAVPSAARPYRRMPQMVFTFDQPQIDEGVAYRLQSEWVRFDQEDQLTGARLDLQPELSWPLQRAAGFMIPRLSLRYTRYDLTRLPSAPADTADVLTRTLPVVTLDNGLFLERDMAWGIHPLLHTLEPRLFYLYAPYRDQSALPVFDSGAMDFNFTQLFRDNRFSGVDRVGDANQISAALTTRVLGRDNGAEYLRLSLGQIYYLQDRRVTFPGGVVETRHNSDVVAEAAAALAPAWTVSGDAYWNPNLEQIERGSVQIRYSPHKNSILNMAYRYRRQLSPGQTDQIDISTFFPLHRQWNFIGRWYYSIPDNRILESLAGLEYQSCCWAFTIVNRRYTTTAGEMNGSFMMQLELKGLMSVGSSVKTVLERGILGYQNER